MNLRLRLSKRGRDDAPRCHLVREVNWPCAPAENGVVFVGREPNGEGSSINARVRQVDFSTDGVDVVTAITHAGEEYEPIKEALLRDGFRVEFENG